MNKIPLDKLEIMSPKELSELLLDELKSSSYILDNSYIKDLINAGASLEAKDYAGFTPLQYAAHRGLVEAVKALLEAGADLETKDGDDWTPLHRAAYYGKVEVIKLLIKAGASLGEPDTIGCTALYLAASSGHMNIVTLLLTAGAPRDKKSVKLLKTILGHDGYIYLLNMIHNNPQQSR